MGIILQIFRLIGVIGNYKTGVRESRNIGFRVRVIPLEDLW
jgi:hypothetical protein